MSLGLIYLPVTRRQSNCLVKLFTCIPRCYLPVLISLHLNFKGKILSGCTVQSREILNWNAASLLSCSVPNKCPVQAGTRFGPQTMLSCPHGILLRGLLRKDSGRPRPWPPKRVPRHTFPDRTKAGGSPTRLPAAPTQNWLSRSAPFRRRARTTAPQSKAAAGAAAHLGTGAPDLL